MRTQRLGKLCTLAYKKLKAVLQIFKRVAFLLTYVLMVAALCVKVRPNTQTSDPETNG